MTAQDPVAALADAVLYEGYLLYPYRPSSVKNKFRWNFGVLYPPAYARASSEASSLRAEVLVEGPAAARVRARARFLQLEGQAASPREAAGPWEELGALSASARNVPVRCGPAEGELRVSAVPVGAGVFKLAVTLANLSEAPARDRDEALAASLLSAQLLLECDDGLFVSPADPPPALREAAAACRCAGSWPVLVGREGARNAMLCAPIILPDYPKVAPQSRGDLFDGTEIDEILTLRVRTLAPEEKREVSASDARARALLERSDALSADELARLHAAMEPSGWRPGQRVRLRPKRRADIMDLALDGRTAVVQSVERDFEDRLYVTVTVDDDPGRDLGREGRPGHRFFFDVDEVEAL